MKRSITVYWGWDHQSGDGRGLIETFPTKLLNDLSKDFQNNTTIKGYLKCPAAHEELKNTFIFKHDLNSIEFGYKNNQPGYKWKNNPNTVLENQFISFRDLKTRCADIHTNLLLFSDHPLEISQVPATFSTNSFSKNTILFSGRYNIGKWLRPLIASFYIHSGNDIINIDQGDDLFYIKFHTDKKINFKRFNTTSNLLSLIKDLTYYKFWKSNTPLKTLYNIFLKKNYKNRILKEIKSNLTGY